MPLVEHELLAFYDKLNMELNSINSLLKQEKETKRIKLLNSQSSLINTVLNKLNNIKMNNKTLLED
jgi:hypothetical protein